MNTEKVSLSPRAGHKRDTGDSAHGTGDAETWCDHTRGNNEPSPHFLRQDDVFYDELCFENEWEKSSWMED